MRWGTGAPAEWRLASNALLFIEEEEEDLGSQEARANLSGILVAVGVALSAKKMWQAGLTVRLLVVLAWLIGVQTSDSREWCGRLGFLPSGVR